MTTLAQARHGTDLIVISVPIDHTQTRRLGEFGVRRGSHCRVVQATAGGGRLVDVGGTRIALGRDLAALIEVEPGGDGR